MIQKICSLPPNLLIQGKTGLWPVKGAPSKYSGGSSLGREKFVASFLVFSTEKKKTIPTSEVVKTASQTSSKKESSPENSPSNSAAAAAVRKPSFCKLTSTTNSYATGNLTYEWSPPFSKGQSLSILYTKYLLKTSTQPREIYASRFALRLREREINQ